MTVTNGHKDPREDPSNRSGDDALDELLDSLRTDQGGARTQALKRALSQETGTGSATHQRIEALETTVQQLKHDVAAREADGDGSLTESARTELEEVTDELQTLQTAVDDLETADGDRTTADDSADRIDDLETSLGDLDQRHTTVEESIHELRSELAATRQTLETADADPSGDQSAQAATHPDVASRVDHLERVLDTRTSALASKTRKVEALETRIDELESSVDDRTATLENELEAVNETLEKAATMLQSETRDELETVRTRLESRLETLESEFRSSIESLEDDVDTLEWHAVDMIQWRKSYEDRSDTEESAHDADRT